MIIAESYALTCESCLSVFIKLFPWLHKYIHECCTSCCYFQATFDKRICLLLNARIFRIDFSHNINLKIKIDYCKQFKLYMGAIL